jgi:hypothetical protein
MGTVALVFAPLAPVVVLLAAIVFWTGSWVYKYQLMFVYISKVETGGVSAINSLGFCMDEKLTMADFLPAAALERDHQQIVDIGGAYAAADGSQCVFVLSNCDFNSTSFSISHWPTVQIPLIILAQHPPSDIHHHLFQDVYQPYLRSCIQVLHPY